MKTDSPATSFDPVAALSDPGFTPGARHLAALLDLFERAGDEQALLVERVIARSPAAALSSLEPLWRGASPPFRRRLARLLARLASSDPRAIELLLEGLAAEDMTVRRWAARGLGQAPEKSERAETALLDAFDSGDLPLQRAIADALGKVGGERSLALLKRASGDAELERRARRSLLMLARGEKRLTESRILLDAPLGEPVRIVARSRAGLSELLREELAELGARATTPSSVELSFAGTLRELYRARIALDFAIRLDAPSARGRAEAVAASLASQEALRVLRTWTEGPLRFRLEFAGGGHRRSEVWKIAELVAARTTELVNDPREAPWEVIVTERLERDGLLLVPKGAEDPRFAYRRRSVPAASHPTLAAALARLAGARPDDFVWDPFVGSGLELVERARLGPYQRLLGSDVDPRALAAARENLKSADISATLEQGDALTLRPDGVTLIVTNPPMGRRVLRDGSIGELLRGFVGHASRVLAPGGRLVWLSPLGALTAEAGRRVGLRVETLTRVDMQGFDADLQLFRRA